MGATLSKEVHNRILDIIIEEKLSALKPVKKPRCFLLGGQPGAGKTNVRRGILQSKHGAGALVVDPDELRTYHPQYLEFVKADPETAAGMVHEDAIAWANELRREAIRRKVNIVYDGTLGNSNTAPGLVNDAASGGYKVEVHVVATSLEISKQSVRLRYEKAFDTDLEDAAPPRMVSESIQTSAYNGIKTSIRRLAATGKVSRMRVVTRNGDSLSDIAGSKAVKKDNGGSALQTLEWERTRPWTEEEIEEYRSNQQKTEELMSERAESCGQEAQKEKILKTLQQIHEAGVDIVERKTKAMVSDEEAERSRANNTLETVKKNNWRKKFLSLFAKKKKLTV